MGRLPPVHGRGRRPRQAPGGLHHVGQGRSGRQDRHAARARPARELPQDVPLGPQRLLRSAVLARVPHAHRHPRLHGGARRRRRQRRRAHRPRRAAVPRHPRARLPAVLRARVPPRRRGRADRHLRPAPGGRRPQRDAAGAGRADRPAGRRHRRRPGRPRRRLVPHRARARGHHVRRQRGAGRDAALQHPRVPAAREGRGEGARPALGRRRALRRRVRARLRGRPRRALRRRLRRGDHQRRHVGGAASTSSPATTPPRTAWSCSSGRARAGPSSSRRRSP